MEVEKLSVEEIRQQAASIMHMLDAGQDRSRPYGDHSLLRGRHLHQVLSRR